MEFRWMTSDQDLSDAYALRIEVFCDEQGYSPDQELDATDTAPDTLHVVLYDHSRPAGHGADLLEGPPDYRFGPYRGEKGLARRGIGALMVEEMNRKAMQLGARISQLDAQKRASGFYEKQGYHICSAEHMDGHVLHVGMEKRLDSDKLL